MKKGKGTAGEKAAHAARALRAARRAQRTQRAAAEAAVKALGMSHPVDALHTLWKLRAIHQAEHPSARNAAQAHVTAAVQGDARPAAHNVTHKPLAKGAVRTDERSVITPGHRGQTEPAREEEGKGRLGLSRQTVAVSGQPNQLSKGQEA